MNGRENIMKIFTAALLLGLAVIPNVAAAQDIAAEPSSAYVYGGTSIPTDGYHDRYFVGAFANIFSGDVGIHADAVYVDREQRAAFAAIGGSVDLGGVRPKVMIGTSTDNRNILPELYALGEVRVRAGQTIITPALAYRRYRTGAKEYTPALDVAHYFHLTGDPNGYYAAQARVAYSAHAGKDAPSFGAGITTVRSSGVSLGVYAEAGRLAYSSMPGVAIDSRFWSVRPSLGMRLSQGVEIVLRGEYSHNDYYDTRGALLGVRLNLP